MQEGNLEERVYKPILFAADVIELILFCHSVVSLKRSAHLRNTGLTHRQRYAVGSPVLTDL